MNTEKVQSLINQIIETNRKRIGGKAARKQYAPAKHQIVTLTELGIIDLMPAGFGHSDASVVIVEAQHGESAVLDANYEGTEIASSKLYDALHEVEEVEEIFVPIPTYVPNRKHQLAALIRDREIVKGELARGKQTQDTWYALAELNFQIRQLSGS